MKRFRMVSTRRDALWRNAEVGAQGVTKLILSGETEEDVRWFFSKIDWTAWALIEMEEPAHAPRSASRKEPAPAA